MIEALLTIQFLKKLILKRAIRNKFKTTPKAEFEFLNPILLFENRLYATS